MILTIITIILASMLVLVAIPYVADVVAAKRSVKGLSLALLEMRMKPFSSFRDNRKRQEALERADAYLQRARSELKKRNWSGARINSSSGLAVLARTY